jgi:hypothetical protein
MLRWAHPLAWIILHVQKQTPPRCSSTESHFPKRQNLDINKQSHSKCVHAASSAWAIANARLSIRAVDCGVLPMSNLWAIVPARRPFIVHSSWAPGQLQQGCGIPSGKEHVRCSEWISSLVASTLLGTTLQTRYKGFLTTEFWFANPSFLYYHRASVLFEGDSEVKMSRGLQENMTVK